MSLLSIEFGIIFPVFLLVYWLLRNKPSIQNKLLLIASYAILYRFDLYFLYVIVCYTLVTYFLSYKISQNTEKKFWFILALTCSVANLAIFKYFDFFRSGLQNIFLDLGLNLNLPVLEIIMPLGISFYTFHSISYIVSIKRKEVERPSLFDFALFLSFFPSLVSGPINRAKDFLPQITTKEPREIGNLNKAYVLVILAVFKVLWLSSALAENWIDPVFANPKEFHSLDILSALYMYAIQIYLNFSGYTDLVTAIAILMGFTLPINFKTPYLAVNLKDFWQRWHISLSSWIRDYIYIPLGGSKKGFTRTQFNLMIAMLLSGLWHGASLNFIIWGGIHGLGVVILNISDKFIGKNKISQHSKLLATFITIQYVCFTWIFFRCGTFGESVDFLSALINNYAVVPLNFNSIFYLAILAILLISYPLISSIPERMMSLFGRIHWSILPIIIVFVLWLIISVTPAGIPNFIYSNF